MTERMVMVMVLHIGRLGRRVFDRCMFVAYGVASMRDKYVRAGVVTETGAARVADSAMHTHSTAAMRGQCGAATTVAA
jgi:hypothetical protein